MNQTPARRTSIARAATRALAAVTLIICVAGTAAGSTTADLLHAGPMLGFSELKTTSIWVQTTRAATVQLRYFPADAPEQARLTSARIPNVEDQFSLDFRLADLEPGIRYKYELYIDGELIERPYPLEFSTQPLWQYRTDPPPFRVLIGSCTYFNEPVYDRPGKPYGSDHEIFDTMAREDAALMVWMGDNLYTREVDFYSPEGLARRYKIDRGQEVLQPFFAKMGHIATWDDHDYGPNNSDRYYPLKETSQSLFETYWPAPAYGIPGAPGVYQHLTYNDIEFFLTDCRTYRMPPNWPEGRDKTYLGPQQMQWLKASLLGSRAPFKIIVGGSQMLNTAGRFESMTNYETELDELLDFIKDQGIQGVVFLSGDRHHTELLKLEREGFYPLYEFTSSPLTAGARERKKDDPEFNNPLRVDGTLYSGKHNYGVLEVTGPRTERVLTLKAMSMDGETVWTHVIAAADLKPPKK